MDGLYDRVYSRGALNEEVMSFLRETCTEDMLPYKDEHGSYRLDWNIIGLHYSLSFGYGQLLNNELYPKRPDGISFEMWEKSRRPLWKWLTWTSIHTFDPITMIKHRITTTNVYLRISVSTLDKLEIPKVFSDEIFHHMMDVYHARRKGYDNFYYTKILEVPF